MRDNAVLLALNDRGEWELPGGQLEAGESLEQCVRREISEEAGLEVTVGPVIHSWVFEVVPTRHVVVIAYGCNLVASKGEPRSSQEHSAVRFIPMDGLDRLRLPDGYRAAINAWHCR